MNRSMLILAIAAFATFGLPSVADDREDLLVLLEHFLAGVDRADVHDTFWADDLIYTSSRGTRTTKADIMRAYTDPPPPGDAGPATIYSAEEVQVRLFGDTAVVAFRLVAVTTPAKPDAGPDGEADEPSTPAVSEYFNTGTFVKRDGRWQAVAWQATKIPD